LPTNQNRVDVVNNQVAVPQIFHGQIRSSRESVTDIDAVWYTLPVGDDGLAALAAVTDRFGRSASCGYRCLILVVVNAQCVAR
jgi:hypothetical protein